jgi:hypothetical protein
MQGPKLLRIERSLGVQAVVSQCVPMELISLGPKAFTIRSAARVGILISLSAAEAFLLSRLAGRGEFGATVRSTKAPVGREVT